MKKSASHRFKKCILHIGTEKTGTTAIQHHLISQRANLLKHGVLYPKAANQEHTSQWEFVAIAQSEPWTQDIGRALRIESRTDQDDFRERLRDALEAEFSTAQKAHTLLISSEHFQSRLYSPKTVEALKAFLQPWVESFEIVVYFRRQDTFALSLLSTHLKSSVKLPEWDALSLLNRTPRYFEYDLIYQKWADVFGDEAMRPRLYDPAYWESGDLVHDFCATAGLPPPATNTALVNTSLSAKGFHFLRALNSRFPVTPGDLSDKSRAALVKAVSTLYAGKFYPISRQQAVEFMSQFEETNENLRQMAFPDLPALLFGDDFSEYPEEAESLEPNYEDAAEVAMAVWRMQSDQRIEQESFIRRFTSRLSRRSVSSK